MENNSAVANRKIQTRSQKVINGTGDDLKEILNNVGDDQPEVKALIQDQVYHSFVEVCKIQGVLLFYEDLP